MEYRTPQLKGPSPAPSAEGAGAVREIVCRSILSPSRIPGADYSINPYIGGLHACVYCYARYMRRWSGHEEPWGTFADAKINAVRVLVRQLRRTRPSRIYLSSVTDPYQPPERRYRITRGILETLAPLPHSVGIQTKSALVTRHRPPPRLPRRLRDRHHHDERSARRRPARTRRPAGGGAAAGPRDARRGGDRHGGLHRPGDPARRGARHRPLARFLAAAGVRRVLLDDLHYLPRLAGRLIPALRACVPEAAQRLCRRVEDCPQQTARIVLECCRAHGIRCDVLFPLRGGSRSARNDGG